MQAIQSKTHSMVYIALCAGLMAVCSWISVPTAVPFTLQTFGVFTVVGILGGRRGTLAVLLYILLGAVGLPVFAGFTSGIGVLMGTTGGYIVGFLFSALAMWGMERLPGPRRAVLVASMVAGLVVCYTFGTAWFMAVYTRASGAVSLGTVLGWCVLPFVLPDLIKIALAMVVTDRVGAALGR